MTYNARRHGWQREIGLALTWMVTYGQEKVSKVGDPSFEILKPCKEE